MPGPFVVSVPRAPLGYPRRLATPLEVRVKPGKAIGAYLKFEPPPRHTTSGQPKHHPGSPGLQYRGHATVGRHFLKGGDRIRLTEIHVQVPKGIPEGNPYEVAKGVVLSVKGKATADDREYFFYLIHDGERKVEQVSADNTRRQPRPTSLDWLKGLTVQVATSVTRVVELIAEQISDGGTETQKMARWLLNVESEGMIDMRTICKEDLQTISDGGVIRDIDQQVIPTESIPILSVVVRAVQVLQESEWSHPVLKCGTFLRWEDDDPAEGRLKGQRRTGRHGKGEAIDLPMEMDAPEAVERVAAILGSLDPAKKYGVGLPAQDPFFFRPQDVLSHKKKVEEEQSEEDRSQAWISGLVYGRGILFRTRWLPDQGRWTDEEAMPSGPIFAPQLLQPRPGWAAVENMISRIVLFLDGPNHLHLDVRA